MKVITFFITLFISFSSSAYWCGEGKIQSVPWGSIVDVECTESVVFNLPLDLKIEDFEIRIEEVGGFECYIETVTNSNGHGEIHVNWFPGNDSSGCEIGLFSKTGIELSTSQLFMSY